MKSKLIILAAALVLVAAACNKSSTTSSDTSGSTNQTGNSSSNSSDNSGNQQAQSGTVEIDMTDSGFSPSEVTVKSGTTVVFKNTGSKPAWPASNPHPVHTDLSGFDAKRAIANGDSYSFTFTKVGVWGFHNHLAPSEGGHVTVVQ